jgi:hypothetical protein
MDAVLIVDVAPDAGDAVAPLPDGQAPRPAWAMIFEGATSVDSVVTDDSGNAYVAIKFDPSVRLPAETLTSAGGLDGVVIKVSPSGEILWRRQIGGPGQDLISDLEVGDNDTLWAIGRFEQTVALPGVSLTSLGSTDVLLLSLSQTTGDVFTARGYGSSEADWGNVVTMDAQGRLALAGWFRDTLSLDDRLVAGGGGQWDGFLALMAPGAARPDWVRVMGGFGNDGIGRVAVAADGDIAVTGIQDGVTSFGCSTHTSTALSHAFVARYGRDGSCKFSKSYGRLGWNGAGGVAFAPSGDLVVTGAFEGPIDFGGGETVSHCAQVYCQDGFIVRLSPSGAYRWSHTWGDATGDDSVGSVAITADDQIYTVGSFLGTIDIGGNASPSAGGRDAVAVLLSATGQVLWTMRFASDGDDSLGMLALAPSALYLGGRLGGALATPSIPVITPATTGGGALLVRLERQEGATP